MLLSGIHNITEAEYHADPCVAPSLSSSLAKLMIGQSPLHARTASARLNPDYEPVVKKTFDIGKAAHRAVLGKGGDYVAIPDEMLASNGAASPKEAKAFIEEARANGQTPLKSDEVDQVGLMADIARAKLAAMGIALDLAHSEVAAIAEIEGCWCRALVDNAPPDAKQPLYDFKTCEDASPDACIRAVMNYGYDIQAAHYLETWAAATGEHRLFRFIFQEKSAPHEVCVVELGEDTLFMARKRTARARDLWRQCLAADFWPGYPPGIHRVDLPDFYQAKWLDRESRDAAYRNTHGHDPAFSEAKPKPSREAIAAARQFQAPEGHNFAGE
jgi:hypothetical protein